MSPKKILLIDDDQFMRDVVSGKLAAKGFEVTTAATGEIGFTEIDSSLPDLILLDLDLPDMSGVDILQELKSSGRTNTIPVIIFSNNDDPDTKAKTVELGANDFYIKMSINVDELAERISKLI